MNELVRRRLSSHDRHAAGVERPLIPLLPVISNHLSSHNLKSSHYMTPPVLTTALMFTSGRVEFQCSHGLVTSVPHGAERLRTGRSRFIHAVTSTPESAPLNQLMQDTTQQLTR